MECLILAALVVIGLFLFGGIIAFTLLLIQIKNKNEEIFKRMTQQEQVLNEQISALSDKMDNIQSGVDTLQETQSQMAQEIEELKAANPDLSDEIARLEELNQKAASTIADIAGELPPDTGNGETGGDAGDGETGELPSGGDTPSGGDVVTETGGDVVSGGEPGDVSIDTGANPEDNTL